MKFTDRFEKWMIKVRTRLLRKEGTYQTLIRSKINNTTKFSRYLLASKIGDKKYNKFSGELDFISMQRLKNMLKSDTEVKRLIFRVDKLQLEFEKMYKDMYVRMYKSETRDYCRVWNIATKKSLKLTPMFTKKEIAALDKVTVAGLTFREYIEQYITELRTGIIRAIIRAVNDTNMFETGMRAAIRYVNQEFNKFVNKMSAMMSDTVTVVSNLAIDNAQKTFKVPTG